MVVRVRPMVDQRGPHNPPLLQQRHERTHNRYCEQWELLAHCCMLRQVVATHHKRVGMALDVAHKVEFWHYQLQR